MRAWPLILLLAATGAAAQEAPPATFDPSTLIRPWSGSGRYQMVAPPRLGDDAMPGTRPSRTQMATPRQVDLGGGDCAPARRLVVAAGSVGVVNRVGAGFTARIDEAGGATLTLASDEIVLLALPPGSPTLHLRYVVGGIEKTVELAPGQISRLSFDTGAGVLMATAD